MEAPTQADFFYRIHDDIIAILDTGRGLRSVTNEAEAVVAEIIRVGVPLAGKRLIYWDGQGSWDELVVEDDRFVRFNLLNAFSLDHARAIMAAQAKP